MIFAGHKPHYRLDAYLDVAHGRPRVVGVRQEIPAAAISAFDPGS
jgi:hypothetical protein